MLVDSHCHLDFPELSADLDGVLSRAHSAGVGTLVTISTKLSEFGRVSAIADAHPDVWCSVGVHPHEAAVEAGADDAARLATFARHPRAIGIGETGLDYYYEHSPRDAQKRAFRAHCAAAREARLPLIVHTRDADNDTIQILREESRRGALTGLIHCFTAGPELADFAVNIGFYISISGIVTFKAADALRQTVKRVPLERLLVETDAPYLAPMPKRGKRNEPAFVAYTAAALAGLKGVSADELARVTTANFFRLFRKATAPAAEALGVGDE
ncbi:MAG TPA: TatD family hydrolase [Alphaproteobacteria bacterium]|nr:TatD family hydrolase [Alphaproteobacteria bacterium]